MGYLNSFHTDTYQNDLAYSQVSAAWYVPGVGTRSELTTESGQTDSSCQSGSVTADDKHHQHWYTSPIPWGPRLGQGAPEFTVTFNFSLSFSHGGIFTHGCSLRWNPAWIKIQWKPLFKDCALTASRRLWERQMLKSGSQATFFFIFSVFYEKSSIALG